MASRMGEGGGEGRPHKPFLIDPAEEGTRPQGVDGAWWAHLISGRAQRVLPKRFRGLPPLFYLPALVGIAWGAGFLFLRISGTPLPPGVEVEPTPPLPNAILDVTTILMAGVGVLQGVGTLYRKKWGLKAAYAWFALVILFCWLAYGWSAEESATSAVDVVGLLANTALFVGFIVYYHNRSGWFGRPAPR